MFVESCGSSTSIEWPGVACDVCCCSKRVVMCESVSMFVSPGETC